MPNKSYRLFLDDIREPHIRGDIEIVICRDYQSAVETVKTRGIPTEIDFDNDLGLFSEGDGRDFAKWLCAYMIDNEKKWPPGFKYYVHTGNPVAKDFIEDYMAAITELEMLK